MKRLALALVAAMLSLAVPGPADAFGDYGNDGIDKDCSDFSTHEEARDYFVRDGTSIARNVDLLDGDADGSACDAGGGTSSPSPAPRQFASTAATIEYAHVMAIVDGDTFRVRYRSGTTATVRMLGIDAPELAHCGYRFARKKLASWLPLGATVKLTSDPSQADIDRYGRVLRYVARGSRDVNKSQLAAGSSMVYVYHQTPFKRVVAYWIAEASARHADWGLWHVC